MMNRQTSVAYIDTQAVLVIIFVVLCGMLLSVNQKISEGNVKSRAEFLISADWEEHSSNDVDLWLRDPTGYVTFFRNKTSDLTNLERDNLGINNNVPDPETGKSIDLPVRNETITIRGILPGRYGVNVNLYRKRLEPTSSVFVRVIKLNPYSVVAERRVVLTNQGEVAPVVTFDVARDGSVRNVNTSTPEVFAK